MAWSLFFTIIGQATITFLLVIAVSAVLVGIFRGNRPTNNDRKPE